MTVAELYTPLCSFSPRVFELKAGFVEVLTASATIPFRQVIKF